MVEIDPDYEDFYECRGPSNKAVRIMWLCVTSVYFNYNIYVTHVGRLKITHLQFHTYNSSTCNNIQNLLFQMGYQIIRL